MDVVIIPLQRKIPCDMERLKRHAVWALRSAGKPSASVSLVLVNDRRMRSLNTLYRGKRKTTDVLSFEAGDTVPGRSPNFLGDVVISLPQALRQSQDLNIPFEDELTNLAIHGLCHLLGYDHEKDEGSALEMKLLEEKMAKAIRKKEGNSHSHDKITGKITLNA